MRVLLVEPDCPNVNKFVPQYSILAPPLGLESIAAYINDIAVVKIIDKRIEARNSKEFKKIIEDFKPDYVGISCKFSSQIYNVYKIADIVKSYNIKTVVGGWHPTLVPDETLEYHSIDFIVRGEGEKTFRELIKKNNPIGILGLSFKQNGKIIHNLDRELIDFKKTLIPTRYYRSKIAKKKYNYFALPVDCIETSRGCPYSCNFCCIHHFFRKKYRQRTIKSIIKELKSKEIKNRASLIFIVDDNFMVNKKFVMEFCDAIIKNRINKYFMTQARVDMIVKYPEVFKKMADAGFIHLFLGFESFSNRTLEKLNKQIKFAEIQSALKILHAIGYFVQGNIILGANIEDKKEDLESSIKIAKSLDIDLPTFSLLTPFPGTKVMEQVLKDNLLFTKDWSKFNWSDPVIKYPHLSSEELKYYLSKAYKETLFSKNPWQGIERVLKMHGFKFHFTRLVNISLLRRIPDMIKDLLVR